LLLNASSSRGGGFNRFAYTRSLNASFLVSTAQAIRAFFAAIAMTAFQ
jgi:hypothetical protein